MPLAVLSTTPLQPLPLYVHTRTLPKVGWLGRLIALCVAMAGLSSLVIAMTLSPDPRGVETHMQLGMDPCGFLKTTGLPCMACGMTTSYAHLLKGHLWTSVKTQPMGTLIAFLAAVGFVCGLYISVTGRPSTRWLERIFTTKLLLGLLALGLAAWGYKIVSMAS